MGKKRRWALFFHPNLFKMLIFTYKTPKIPKKKKKSQVRFSASPRRARRGTSARCDAHTPW
jgi:hypothetical protein